MMFTSSVVPLDGFTFGCDPELFIVDSKGKPVSAADIIPGTKAVPFKVRNGAVQRDGMAAEFNIDPVTTFKDFNSNITSVMKQMREMLPEGHEFLIAPSVVFDKDVWDAAPDDAKELGCTPDFNAWTGECNPPPNDPDNPYLRTASGHIHIGWTQDAEFDDPQHIINCQDLVKQLDWFLGPWSLTMDSDERRRKLYGKAGACRYKDYGVEYRVLSNFWLVNDSRRKAVWDRVNCAINNMRNGFFPEQYRNYCNMVRESIDTSTRNSFIETNFRFPARSIML